MRDHTASVLNTLKSGESALLGPIRRELLSPERIARTAVETQAMFAEQVKRRTEDAAQRPGELADLDARIERLRERQRTGDPDLTADERQSAIDRAIQKRSQLEATSPKAKRSAAVLAMLPKAAALYRQQIELGLEEIRALR